MLPLVASLTFQTAPTVFPLVSSVADDDGSTLPKTRRSLIHQARLEPSPSKKQQEAGSIMGYPASQSIFRSGTSVGSLSDHDDDRRQPPSPRASRRSRQHEASNAPLPASASTIPPLASWMDRMLCCGLQHQQFAHEEEEELRWHTSPTTAKLSERALQSFPGLELARELRESGSGPASPSYHHHLFKSGPIQLFEPATDDFANKDKAVRLLFPVVGPPPPPPPPRQPRSSTKGAGRFVLDGEDRRQDDRDAEDDEEHKKSTFYKQVMTRSSTATTASMGRSASSLSESSLQSWNTLPTQPSDLDEDDFENASAVSEPQKHRDAGSATTGAAGGTAKLVTNHPHRHKRQSTDPKLAERFLVQQLKEKLVQHQQKLEDATVKAKRAGSRASVYYQQQLH